MCKIDSDVENIVSVDIILSHKNKISNETLSTGFQFSFEYDV